MKSRTEDRLASWDVFHGDRLELERGLSAETIRAALARGELRDDDLIRPAGTTVAWVRLAEIPELMQASEPALPASAPALEHAAAASPIADLAGTSDFEVQASEPASDLSIPPALTTRAPDWLELGADPDDVTFPVMKDEPADVPVCACATEIFEPRSAEAGLWPDDAEDDDDQDSNGELDTTGPAGAGDLEILDDDEPEVISEAAAPPTSTPDDDVSKLLLPVVESRAGMTSQKTRESRTRRWCLCRAAVRRPSRSST